MTSPTLTQRWSLPASALLLVLFGYFLHPHKILSLVCLGASLFLVSNWMWKAPVETVYRTLALTKSPVNLTATGALLGPATAMLLRWFQNRTLHPNPLRPFLLVSMSIGLAEEFVFRGYFLGRLRERLQPWAAVLASSLLHTAYKTAIFVPSSGLNELAFLAGLTFAFGLLLGYWRVKAGSIWPCALFHALFDLWTYGDRTTPWWVW